jgi:O-acetyl-ADP-ribose deacetylase (regulator of RNase III)
MPDNIFDSDCTAIVNTTNIQGIMGAGLAGQFRRRYPEMNAAYEEACADGTHRMGEMLLYFDQSGKVIVNFPTMKFPGMRADLADIENGLRDLRKVLVEEGIDSVAIPALGCGIGRLDFGDVEELIQKILGDMTGEVRVDVYPPDRGKYQLL